MFSSNSAGNLMNGWIGALRSNFLSTPVGSGSSRLVLLSGFVMSVHLPKIRRTRRLILLCAARPIIALAVGIVTLPNLHDHAQRLWSIHWGRIPMVRGLYHR